MLQISNKKELGVRRIHTYIHKYTLYTYRAGGVAQMVKRLPNKPEVNPSATKKRKRKKALYIYVLAFM
jgi:hypothetical protein